jgi:transposase
MSSKKQLDVSLKNHVISLYERDYKVSDIAEIYQVTNKTIYNVINNHNKNGSVQRKKGAGRKMDENILKLIIDIVNNDHNVSLSDISSILLNDHDIKYPKSTVYDYLIKNDFVNKNPILKPLLTDDHLNQRENWAIFYQNYNWNNVIWSDETTISIQSNKLSKIWIHKDDTVINRIIKYPLKIHIWGCILKNYKLIVHICNKTMNSTNYIAVLKKKLLPRIKLYEEKTGNKIIFQQDNAPCHTSFKMCEFFSNNNIEVMMWPANSPDLSPIENIWGILKNNVGKN